MDRACLTAFGSDIVYLPTAGGQVSVRGVFQAVHEAEDAAPGVYAVLFVHPEDLPAAPVLGDKVQVGGAQYKLFATETDVSGAALLRLRKD